MLIRTYHPDVEWQQADYPILAPRLELMDAEGTDLALKEGKQCYLRSFRT